MRMAQYYGLNSRAKKLVHKKVMAREVGTMHLPDGSRVKFDRRRPIPVAKKQVIGDIKTYDPRIPLAQLFRYTLPDGVVYEEYIQEVLHSGGPCYFLALRSPDGTPLASSLWSNDEMYEFAG